MELGEIICLGKLSIGYSRFILLHLFQTAVYVLATKVLIKIFITELVYYSLKLLRCKRDNIRIIFKNHKNIIMSQKNFASNKTFV